MPIPQKNDKCCETGDQCLFPLFKILTTMTKLLLLLRKMHHNWVLHHKMQMLLKQKVSWERNAENLGANSWNDPFNSRHVIRVSGTRSPDIVKLEHSSNEETEAMFGISMKTFTRQINKTAFYVPGEGWTLLAASTRAGEKRVCN